MKKPLLLLCTLMCIPTLALANTAPKTSSVTVRITATILPHCEVRQQPPVLTKKSYVLTSVKKCNNGKPPEIITQQIPLSRVNAFNKVTHTIRAD
jgi:hypothetical protein